MKLSEALGIVRAADTSDATVVAVSLACGFNSVHLETMIVAHARVISPAVRLAITGGTYGDVWGNIERACGQPRDAMAIVLEWSDLDPRLGFRSLGDWSPSGLDDILRTVEFRAAQLVTAVNHAAQDAPVVISFPTLPVPPVSFEPGWQASIFELQLRRRVSDLAATVAAVPQARVVNSQRLEMLSPLDRRLDLASELISGSPYQVAHASALGKALAQLIVPPSPKKGLIVDLDNTVWRGILGEVDVDGVSWTLEHGSQAHGMFQLLVHSLRRSGVLVAVASKNDLAMVEQAFDREGMILKKDDVFPFEVHWGPKSESVARILKAWNVSADSVVFVDDSPLELAEVKASHVDIQCLLFPHNDTRAAYALLQELRDLFGKPQLTEEDAFRVDSIRRAASVFPEVGSDAAADTFLQQTNAVLTISLGIEPGDQRALELVNKTNQFNLNGRRHTPVSWRSLLESERTVSMAVSYEDKYGPLGKIAIIAGDRFGDLLRITTWVMSCRAFSRRVEHRTLVEMLKWTGAKRVELEYSPTGRNGPITSFIRSLSASSPELSVSVSAEEIAAAMPRMFHRVRAVADAPAVRTAPLLGTVKAEATDVG